MPRKREIHLKVGHTYGVGSLQFRARTIIALLHHGTIVHYRAEDDPVTAAGPGRVEGSVYICQRRQFLAWLRLVAKESNAYAIPDHERRRAASAPGRS